MCYIKNLLVIFTLILSGCATYTNEIGQYYRTVTPFKQKKADYNVVEFREVPYKPDNKLMTSIFNQGYGLLGTAEFAGPLLTPEVLRRFAASVGGDFILYEKKFAGVGHGSRMVLASYTPPSIGHATSSLSGFSSGTAHSNAYTPWGPISADSYGNVSSFGSSTLTTYNPGQATYARQDFEYPVFVQGLVVLQSPRGQVNNWANIEKWHQDNGAYFNFDDFLSTYKSTYNSLSPVKKLLADAIESGHKFTPLTAKQFLVNRQLIQSQKETFLKQK